jgi:hypothetical protein
MSNTDTGTRDQLARAELADFHGRRRAHDRQFAQLARTGGRDSELAEDLTDESDDLWAEYGILVDTLLRARP